MRSPCPKRITPEYVTQEIEENRKVTCSTCPTPLTEEDDKRGFEMCFHCRDYFENPYWNDWDAS